MRLISVIHILCALVLATVAAPVGDKALSTVDTRDNTEDGNNDTFQTIDPTPPNTVHAISDEVDPEPDDGCVVA
ncbi:hypothetical protein C8R44DRAFT_991465 [Mycena epipterygia]|nr:hypothetical protein C8R44DRAFT_991465 [Mycena epipterygia]